MFKVVVERPRRGHKSCYGDFRRGNERARDSEDLPVNQGMRRPYGYDAKDLNENLNPLKRYLRKQVGRKWDAVHADVCEHVDRGSTVQKHVLDHLADFVAVRVRIADGKIVELRPYGPREVDGLYVDPETGILRDGAKPRQRHVSKPDPDAALIEGREYRRLGGCWFEVAFASLPEPYKVRRIDKAGEPHEFVVRPRMFDVVAKFWTSHDRRAGRTRYAASKRQLATKELRRLGLSNSVEA